MTRRGRLLGFHFCLLTFAFCLLPGCGDGRPKVYPASGTVTHKGKPAAGAIVMLVPQASGATWSPTGTVGPDGSFTLTTFSPNDGAPAGEYKVAVTWRPLKKTALDPDGPDKLAGKYADAAASGLTMKVDAGPNTLKPIALE